MKLGLVIAAALVAIALAREELFTLNVQIEPQREDCFFQDAKAGETLEATFMVYRGGKLDIKLRVEAPDSRVIYEQLLFSNIDDATGKMLSTILAKGHKWGVPVDGTYKICLDNRMAKWTAKVGTLAIRKTDPKDTRGDYGLDTSGKDTNTEGLRIIAQRLHSKLEMISNAQLYHYHRERRNRDTLESNNARVMWWAIVEAVTIFATSFVGAAVVRAWFKRPSMLPGKV